ncbi:stalk domain-containing protein [Paenibacillus methanolicus]|uniref:Ankyrin repeat protein n=1 Tax=Paenibacillus methanolicus TaxID=582686 RepID=A0A5S5BYZ2_9BACL|nr:stalk domain-containing protein [Paenibacillus methanolicus]TYP72405.1 ankyrin repeat protein [Paenibacillus methanolicus]
MRGLTIGNNKPRLTVCAITIAIALIAVEASVPYVSAFAAVQPGTSAAMSITVVKSGAKLALPAPPYALRDTVMVPMKAVLDASGAASVLDRGQITVTLGMRVLKAALNDKRVQVGGQTVLLKEAPTLAKGRLFVPSQLIALALNEPVVYDAKLKQLRIGYTPQELAAMQKDLFLAAMRGDAAAIERLLKRGIDPNAKNKYYGDSTPLDKAIASGGLAAVNMLVAHGASVKLVSARTGHDLVMKQDAAMLSWLLENGFDPNAKDREGATLLELASGVIGVSQNGGASRNQYPLPAMVEALLKHGADPRNDESLYKAVQAQSYPIVQQLLRAGADPHRANRFGDTPIRLAESKGLSKWLLAQETEPLVPFIAFLGAKGRFVEDGTAYIRSAGGEYRPFQWTGHSAYFDLPDGSYTLMGIGTYSWAGIMQQPFVVKDGHADLEQVYVPATNVTGSLTFADGAIGATGFLHVYGSDGNYLLTVPVHEGVFRLYAPEGTYSFREYYADGRVYKAEGRFDADSSMTVDAAAKVLNEDPFAQ